MSAALVIFLIYAISAALSVGLGMPLALRLIPPNRLGGFRVARTLRDPHAWYEVNRVLGLWLIAAGVLTISVATVTFIVKLQVDMAAWINLAGFSVVFVVGIVHCFIVLRRLPEEPSDSEAGSEPS